MANIFEVVTSKDQREFLTQDIIKEATEEWSSDQGAGNANITHVRPEIGPSGDARVILLRQEIRPDKERVDKISSRIIDSDAMSSLGFHLTKIRVEEMVAPFVDVALPVEERRPKGEVKPFRDHYIFDDPCMAMDYDQVNIGVDLEFLGMDLSKSNNIQLDDMNRVVQEGVVELQIEKNAINADKAEMAKVARRILRALSLDVELQAPLLTKAPAEIYSFVDGEVLRYDREHAGNLPATVIPDMTVLYGLYQASVGAYRTIERDGQSLFSMSMRTEGYSYPSIVSTVDDAIRDLQIGSPKYLKI